MKMIRKVFNSVIKDINVAEKTLTALVSTAGQDRMDDVLEPKGADLKNFNKNPVVLWAHDYQSPPIAKALWTRKKEEGVLSKMKFANTEFAQEIFELYKEGFMNAFSVGFIPKQSEPVDPEKTGFYDGKRFTKWEMLEYSAVPVPANPEALALAVSKGIISDEKRKALEEMQKEGEVAFGNEEEDNKTKDGEGDEPEGEPEEEEDDMADPEQTPSDQDKQEEKNVGLADLLGELDLLEEKIVAIEKENAELRYKLYVAVSSKKEQKPEITVNTLADKFREIADGVIRQARGKVD